MGVKKSIGELENEDAIVKIQDGNHGAKHPKSDDYTDNGIPFIMAKDLKSNSIDLQGCKFIPKELADNLRIGFAKSGDVLLTHKGSVGNVAIVPDIESYIMLTPQVTYYRVNETKLINKFLSYAFQHPSFQSQINSESAQSTRPYIGVTSQRRLKVYYYDLSTQQKIASILSAFDDLIENNTRRIAILEETARLIYREWFVHYRYPGHEDDRPVDTETDLGEVPEGWEVKALKDLCELIVGQSPKSEFYNETGEGLPFHQGVKDFGSRFPTTTTWCTVQKRIAEEGDILFSVRAPVGRINIANCKMIIGRGLHAIRSKTENQVFIFEQLKDKFQEEDSMGSGTIYKSVTKGDMLGLKLIYPGSNLIEQFEENVEPIFDQIRILTEKNIYLKETRDLLLPKLISGKVEV